MIRHLNHFRPFHLLGALGLSVLAGPLACSGAPDASPGGEAPDAALISKPAPVSLADSGPGPSPSPSPDAAASPDSAGPSDDDAGAVERLDAAPDVAPDAAPVLPQATGTLVASGATLALRGVTDDGFVVYSERYAVDAVPLAGGTKTTLRKGPFPMTVRVAGTAAYVWEAVPRPHALDVLDVWTAAHGLITLAASSPLNSAVATSPDGKKAAFFVGDGGAPPTLTVENLDGTGAAPLETLCASALEFGATDDLIATDCRAPFTDGGAPLPGLSVFAGASFARTLLTPYFGYVTDPTGTWLWIVGDANGAHGTSGAARLVRAADGATVFTDAAVTGGAFFDATGSTLFYSAGGALKSVSTASPSPAAKTIVPSGCTSVAALAPDGAKLLFSDGAAVYLEPIPTGGAPTTFSSVPLAQYSFSSDSAFVVAALSAPMGDTYEVLPAAGGAPVSRGSKAESIAWLAGAKLLVVSTTGDGDVLDLSGKESPLHVPGMGAFALSRDRGQIAYVATGVETPGVYVIKTGK